MKSYEIFLERATEEFGNISCKESSIEFSREVCRIVGRMGWAGLSIPVDFGGAGASHVERLFSIQASSHCDPSIGVLVALPFLECVDL
ncbi:acyl-CoA dehydrogenase family protein, partial [Corynebacterium sp. HMSC074C11]|uniref:acyl-CoA dehydrogenase family protein n=1 Tax=Corynebacterium sp. HMSC074C11 TaxID=1715093 RepID=UPI00114CA330